MKKMWFIPEDLPYNLFLNTCDDDKLTGRRVFTLLYISRMACPSSHIYNAATDMFQKLLKAHLYDCYRQLEMILLLYSPLPPCTPVVMISEPNTHFKFKSQEQTQQDTLQHDLQFQSGLLWKGNPARDGKCEYSYMAMIVYQVTLSQDHISLEINENSGI
jgi:hypothetical protein